MRLFPLSLLFLLTACSPPTSDPGGSAGSGGPGLRHIEFFQVVSTPVLRDYAQVPDPEAPLVADRAAVLRATVDGVEQDLLDGLSLVVTVHHDGTTDSYTSSGAIDDDNTLLVHLPRETIDPDATWSVALLLDGQPRPVDQFPEVGSAPLAAEVTGPIKIHLVPFELNGFVPDTTQPVIDGYRDAVFAVYPVTEVIITVGDVVPAPPGGGLGDLLVDVGVLQESEAPDDVYYYGMATGVATRDEFDGITGSSQELEERAGFAIGAAFGDQRAEDTLIHELGHLHLLVHADCGGAGAEDPDFPYVDAGIGVEGYDVRSASFVPVDGTYDMMAYCYPRWISDYHYGLLVDWVQHAQRW